MVLYVSIFALAFLNPSIARNAYFLVTLMVGTFAANIGAFWMIYQAIRHENRVGRYVLLAFVPFMFVWYKLVRYPLKQGLMRNP